MISCLAWWLIHSVFSGCLNSVEVHSRQRYNRHNVFLTLTSACLPPLPPLFCAAFSYFRGRPSLYFYHRPTIGGDALVPSAGDPPRNTDVRAAGRPVGSRNHPGGDGHQAAAVPGGFRDRRDLQDFPVSRTFFGLGYLDGRCRGRVACLSLLLSLSLSLSLCVHYSLWELGCAAYGGLYFWSFVQPRQYGCEPSGTL